MKNENRVQTSRHASLPLVLKCCEHRRRFVDDDDDNDRDSVVPRNARYKFARIHKFCNTPLRLFYVTLTPELRDVASFTEIRMDDANPGFEYMNW